jgi:predicted dehydrogenase
MATYKIGVIGHTGRGDYGHGIDVVWQSIPSCQIVAVADVDERGLEEARKRLGVDRGFADYRKMLDEVKPDIVSICPRWLDEHRDMVVAAAERGIHVYMEKPFCRTPREADEIVAVCEKNKVKLAIAFQTRYSPKLRVARGLIDDGAIGRILELRGRGKEDARGGGEDLWVLGTHIMNLMYYFAGDPEWCFGRVWQEGRSITAADVKPGNEGIGPLAGDHVQAMFGFGGGITGFFASQRRMGDGGGRFGLRIIGQLGQIEFLPGFLPAVHLLQDPLWSPGRSGKNWQPVSSLGVGKAEPLRDGGLAAGNVLACQDLLAAIEEDRQPEANMYEARKTVEMISAVFESQVIGGPVELPLKNRDNPLTRL